MAEETRAGDLTRRRLLYGTMLVAGGATLAGLSGCSGEAQTSDALARRLSGVTTRGALKRGGHFFTLDEFETLSRVSDLIVPQTDTPGALAVGVPETIDRMMVTWANHATRAQFRLAVGAIDTAARGARGKRLAALSPEEQFDVLEAHDRAALSAGDADYRQLKSLILEAYYSSEPGATQELRFELVPGEWRACVPFEEIGRTWAA